MTGNNTGSAYLPFGVVIGETPDCKIGRKAIHVTIDFSLGSSFNLDLTQVQSQGAMDSVQTLYIDNSENTFALTLLTGVLVQEIIIPPGAQCYMPILQTNPPIMKFTTGGGTALVDVHILNFFLPPFMWFATGGTPVTDTTLASIIVNGAANVNAQPSTVTGVVDASGTIAAGGTPQVLFALDTARKKWILSNPSTATEILQFSFGTSTNYINLPPGTTWIDDSNAVSGDQINVVAATTGHAFTAFRWG